MPEVTRLASLPKKDRVWIENWLAMRAGEGGDPFRLPAERFAQLADRYPENCRRLADRPSGKNYVYNTPADLLYSDLFHLSGSLQDRGVAVRLVNSDVGELARCLATASRLIYLHETLPAHSQSGYDCMYAKGVLLSLAARDFDAVAAYQASFPQPAKVGSPYLRELANMLGCALGSGPAFEKFYNRSDSKGHSQFTGAVLSTIAAVIASDPDQFLTSLDEVLLRHRATAQNDGLLRYLSIPAHALYVLGERVMGSRLTGRPSHPLWDDAFHAGGAASPDFALIGTYSTEVAQLAAALPLRWWAQHPPRHAC